MEGHKGAVTGVGDRPVNLRSKMAVFMYSHVHVHTCTHTNMHTHTNIHREGEEGDRQTWMCTAYRGTLGHLQ